MHKGACPLVGGAADSAAWGEPARPGFPFGKREWGEASLPCCRRRVIQGSSPSRLRYSAQPPTRPASIRTLQRAVRPGAGWVSQSQSGCCFLLTRTEGLLRSRTRPAVCPQSPELGDSVIELEQFLGCCFSCHAVSQRLIDFTCGPQPM